jgi:signal transduction histidine kinase
MILLSIPILYLVIDKLVVGEIDEKLIEEKISVRKTAQNIAGEAIYDRLVKLYPDLDVHPVPVNRAPIPPGYLTSLFQKDSLYNIAPYDSLYGENVPFRVLSFVVSLSGKPVLIKIRRPLLEAEDLIQSIVWVMFFLLVIIIAGLILLNRRLSGKIWRPFYAILEQLKQYKIETSDPILPHGSRIDEFNDLEEAIHELTRRNALVYRSYKEFTENASHEMQTPLAIFRSRLELLIQTHPFTSEQAGLINDLAEMNNRLSHLNKSLLLLTKIENYYFHERELIQPDELLKRIIMQLQHLADAREISLLYKEDEPIPTLYANRILVELLLTNLISNAIRHNYEKGIVLVGFTAGMLSIKNTGQDFGLDEVRIFDRFGKQSAHAYGTGLGLAISKKITELYGYPLTYRFERGFHIFSLGLPIP